MTLLTITLYATVSCVPLPCNDVDRWRQHNRAPMTLSADGGCQLCVALDGKILLRVQPSN
jgi:hypothetical protein